MSITSGFLSILLTASNAPALAICYDDGSNAMCIEAEPADPSYNWTLTSTNGVEELRPNNYPCQVMLSEESGLYLMWPDSSHGPMIGAATDDDVWVSGFHAIDFMSTKTMSVEPAIVGCTFTGANYPAYIPIPF